MSIEILLVGIVDLGLASIFIYGAIKGGMS